MAPKTIHDEAMLGQCFIEAFELRDAYADDSPIGLPCILRFEDFDTVACLDDDGFRFYGGSMVIPSTYAP